MTRSIFRPSRLVLLFVFLSLLGVAAFYLLSSNRLSGKTLPSPPGRSQAAGPVEGERMLWNPVAIGGGGFITGLSWDRGGTVRVVRTDVYGAYIWDGKRDRWRQLVVASAVPEQDREQDGMANGVYEIVVAPGDGQRLYMATGGRVYRSDDAGDRWTVPPGGGSPFHFDANSRFRLGGPFMAVSPRDPDLVVLGTQDGRFWRSRDGARSWEQVRGLPDPVPQNPGAPIKAPGFTFWFEPGAAADRLWIGVPGKGIYAGDARGDRFAPLPDKSAGGPSFVRRGAFAADGTFFAADPLARKLWRYRQGAWTDLTGTGAVAASVFSAVAVDWRNGTVWALDDGGRLQCSADRGETWGRVSRSSAPGGEREPAWLHVADKGYFATADIALDPSEPGRLWTAAGTGVYTASVAAPCDPVRWQSRTRGIEEIVANDVVQAPGQAPAFAGWDFGIHVKPDLNRFSETYGPRERVLIAAQQLDWTPAQPGFLVTNASDTRKCCAEDGQSVLAGYSEDGGQSWTRFASLPTPPGTKADDPWRMAFGSIAVASDNPDNIIWLPALNRSPFYTLDRGRSWKRVELPGEVLPESGSFGAYYLARKTITADRVLPGTFYYYHSGQKANAALAGLWRTGDGGVNWERLWYGALTPASEFSAKLRAVPGKAGHLFFTSGAKGIADTRLRRSTDGGRTWTIHADIDRVDDIGFGRAAAGSDYPALYLSGRVKNAYGIWRSVDSGKTWQRLVQFPLETLDQVTVVEGDKDIFGRVYIGYKGSGWIYGEPAVCAPERAKGQEGQCGAVGAGVAAR